MKILVLGNCSDEYRPLGNIAMKNKREYCARHGYAYIEDTGIDYSSYTHPSWSKLDSIIKYMKNHDWIFWSDADSLFMNHIIPLKNFIDNRFSFICSLFYSKHFKMNVVHTGNFLIKCSERTEKILKETLSAMEEGHLLREERGLTEKLLNRERRGMVKLCPEATFATWVKDTYIINDRFHEINFPDWLPYKPGNFISHFGSIIPFEGRVFLMKKYARLVIK